MRCILVVCFSPSWPAAALSQAEFSRAARPRAKRSPYELFRALIGAQVQRSRGRSRIHAKRVPVCRRRAQREPVSVSCVDSLADSACTGLEAIVEFVRIDKVAL